MKRLYFLCLIILSSQSYAQTTPQTITMDPASSVGAAFGANGTLGTNSATFYTHWDATYLYVGWSNGQTNYSGDMYYVGIDVIAGQGSNGAIEGVGFSDAVHDFYVVYENNSSFYGLPTTNGNSFEIYQDNGANGWNFVSRTGGDDGTTSQIVFDISPGGEVRLRIDWSTLGVTPGPAQQLGLTFWTNNSSGNFMWGNWPSANPATGSTPQTLTHKIQYTSTANGTDPSTDGVSIPLATTLPVELFDFNGSATAEGVALNWTAVEESFSHYEVQRMVTGGAFESIATVDLTGEAGQINTYQFVDKAAPAEQILLYRLAMVDLDGTVNYSNHIELSFTGKRIALSPNPTEGLVTISLPVTTESAVQVETYNLSGQLVYAEAVDGQQTELTMDLSQLPAGLYQLVVKWDGQRDMQKITLR